MKVFVNFSLAAAQLLREGMIQVDGFKCHTHPEWLEMAQAEAPAYVHLPVNLDEPDLTALDWPMFEDMVEMTGTRFINCHLSADRRKFETGDWDEVRGRWSQGLEQLVRRWGPARVTVENCTYRRPDHHWLRCAVEPENISLMIDEFEVGLLLDTAHACLSALALGVRAEDYLQQLPLDRLADWHVTGTQLWEGEWRDSMSMTEEDWSLAELLVALMKKGTAKSPAMATLEYGGMGEMFSWRSDPAELEITLKRLNQLARQAPPASLAAGT
jgi:hypothetical protein